VRFPPAIVQLRRAQLVLILAVLVPTVLMIAVGIVLLALGNSEAGHIVAGVLVICFCTTAITGYILGSIFVGRGASLARVQNDFLSSVSHELRTPLTAIALFLESLRDGRLSRDDQTRVLDLLGTEVQRLDMLVGRLLELSRLESGAHVFRRERVEVAEIVREAVAAFDAATLGTPTPVAVDVEPGLSIVGDRATLVRAVSNLLVNAWKYTGNDKNIELQARGQGRWIEIAVTDNGIGIPRGERRDMFEEFVRGQEATRRGTPGVGLGLALVRAVVRAHKGTIVVVSREGAGSSFRMRLPRGRLDAITRGKAAA
jgi:two-component system, OmpR family, phosphate regulon sensor histidine kinase PhoR